MAIRNKEELGSKRQVKRRAGIDFQEWGSMDLETDPGAIAPFDFRELWNVDFDGNEIIPRGGSRPIMDEPLDGCWQFLADYQAAAGAGAQRLYVVLGGCPDLSTAGRSIGFYDPDLGATIQRMFYFDWVSANAVLGAYDGDLYFGTDSLFKKLHLTQPVAGEDPLQAAGASQDNNVQSIPGYTVRLIYEFDGKEFVAAELIDDPTDSAVFVWNGSKWQLDIDGIVCPTAMRTFRDKLVLGFPASENKIMVRPPGDAGTAYVTKAGTGAMGTVDMVSHLDNLYGATDGTTIWKFDGTSVTTFHTIAGAAIRSVESDEGFLWFIYRSSTPHAILGRWNEGASFTDVVKDFTAQSAAIIDVGPQVRAFKQNLYVMGVVTSTTGMLLESVGGAAGATGTWNEILSNPNSAVPHCLQLLVF